jgi:secernin
MGCDLVVALPPATAHGHTLFGSNVDRPLGSGRPLCRIPGKEFAPGEKVRAQYVEVLQVRRTSTILGSQPEGWWGFTHGLNEHGLAIGHAPLRNRLLYPQPGLTGGDLVRLALERCRHAHQAVDCLTALVERHGQSPAPGDPAGAANSTFLMADASEAYCVETAGRFWVCQQAHQVKAASNLCQIRQDWDRIAHGLATTAIKEGCWAADGSKLDFAGTLGESPVGEHSGLRRWGRATILLEQQNGHIDANFLRQLLSDHYEGTHFEVDPLLPADGPAPICRHGSAPTSDQTTASFVVELAPGPGAVTAWWAFGPPCSTIYFPVSLYGEPPQSLALGHRSPGTGFFWEGLARLAGARVLDSGDRTRIRDAFERLQSHFDQESEEFAMEAATLRQEGDALRLQHAAGNFMQHCVEEFESVVESLALEAIAAPTPARLAKSER